MISLVLVSSLLGAALADFPLPGEWPCERGNSRLDARAAVKGRITEPRVVWRQFVGATETYVSWEPGPDDTRLSVDPASLPGNAEAISDPRWSPPRRMGEVEGAPRALPASGDTIYVDALPEKPGLERVVFESGFSKPTLNGQWQPVPAHCYAWEDGAWMQVWETPPIDMLFISQAVAGDFDADGNQEIAFLPWYELTILDARTGAVKDRCRFTEGRSYGFLGAYDLDRDGRSEFVVMADFCKHVEVLGYRDGKLALLWQRVIEADISNPQKIMRVNPTAAADVDGDGRLEVLVCTYNDAGDGRWHITVHDGMTGEVKADLVDECLQGVHDVNGDGISELFTVGTTGAGVPEFGTIRVRALRGSEAATLWERGDAGWALWDAPGLDNTNNCATLGTRDVVFRDGDPPTVVWLEKGDTILNPDVGIEYGVPFFQRLTVARWGAKGFEPIGSLHGEELEAVGLAEDGSVLARSVAPPGQQREFSAQRGALQALAARPRGGAPGTVVVARGPAMARPLILAQGPAKELVALQERDGQGAEVWRLPGRGQSTSWPGEARGAVVADLRGDGGRQVVYATASPEGCARLVAAEVTEKGDTILNPDVGIEYGVPFFHHDFAEIPGQAPAWNIGGLVLWQVGHFTDPTRMDVLYTVRRSMMHSEESGVLSGVDGRELWRRNRQIENRGVGGTPFAIADLDGDGLDEIASLYPSEFYILKGATGEDILAKPAIWPEVRASHIYWGQPIAGDFEGTGRMSLFFATARAGMTGLLRPDGSLVWWDEPDLSPNALAAFGDVDGDGKIEAVGVGYPDGVRCYDAATGEVEWTLDMFSPGTGAGMASGDINSDGRDEVLVTIGNVLYCLGTDGVGTPGRLLWRLDLPATIGPPAIADASGDGTASILLHGADGYVYCVR